MPIVDHNKNIIQVRDLSFSYGNREALDGINLCIHKGDYLGIVGPNGGGKTTLIKLILGILKPNQGQIYLFDKPLEDFKEWRKVGYVAQKATNFDPTFPITAGQVAGLGENKKEDVEWALKKVEMYDFKDKLIGQMSGGQQQRIFIARALAQKPELIFLDEPTTGIDASTQEEFFALLSKLNHDLDITLVLISHDINIVTDFATEIAYVNKRLTYFDSAKKFLESHLH